MRPPPALPTDPAEGGVAAAPSPAPVAAPAPDPGWTGAQPQDDDRRPAAWSVPRGVRTASEWSWRLIVIAAATAGILWLLGRFSEVVIPLVIALLLTALLRPVSVSLSRVLPPGLAAGVTVLGTLGLISGILSFVGTQFSSQLGNIVNQTTAGIDEVREWLHSTFHVSDTQIGQWITTIKTDITSGNVNIGHTAAQAGVTATHAVAGLAIALFSLFFFLYEGERIWAWSVRLFPRTARERVHTSGLVAWGQLSAYTRATVLVAAVDAIVIGTGAAILRVPFASGIAVLIFFGAFVPIIGALVSGSVAVLLALVAFGPIKALIMLAVVVGTMQLESHVLQPFLLGRAVRVHPLSVIIAIAAGVVAAGIVGALIAVPTVAVLNAVGHHLLDDHDDAESADEPPTPAEALRARSAVVHDGTEDVEQAPPRLPRAD